MMSRVTGRRTGSAPGTVVSARFMSRDVGASQFHRVPALHDGVLVLLRSKDPTSGRRWRCRVCSSLLRVGGHRDVGGGGGGGGAPAQKVPLNADNPRQVWLLLAFLTLLHVRACEYPQLRRGPQAPSRRCQGTQSGLGFL